MPLAVRLTAANRNDSQEALALVDAIPPLHGERGRPRQRPDCVLGPHDFARDRRLLAAQAPLDAERANRAPSVFAAHAIAGVTGGTCVRIVMEDRNVAAISRFVQPADVRPIMVTRGSSTCTCCHASLDQSCRLVVVVPGLRNSSGKPHPTGVANQQHRTRAVGDTDGSSVSSISKSPFGSSGTPAASVLCSVNGAAASQISVASTLWLAF